VILDGDTQGTARDWRARSPADYDGPRVQAATNPRQLVRSVEEHDAGADVVVTDGSARQAHGGGGGGVRRCAHSRAADGLRSIGYR
jgi:hypothetical protein